MRADFKDVPAVLDYVNKTWIPHKTKFVSAWTYDCLHLRNTTTSCVEGAHAMLKRFLQVLTGDLHAVREEIGRVLAHQVGELKAAEAKEHIRVPHRLRITLFANLVGRIRHFALNLFYGRRQQLNGNAKLPECTGVFQKTLGLPCAQDLAKIPAGAGDLLTDVHLHWHLDIKDIAMDGNCGFHAVAAALNDMHPERNMDWRQTSGVGWQLGVTGGVGWRLEVGVAIAIP
ncbi:hypothetical protein AXG93_4486s1120 [Marchantia polymorpha subsp. ruderalis]|uniref:Protein FAR1-RELATED SEQUENCE n=1 Tax=Marchantia polymorpha subsp. ruderalis TaxID=1480154 RepID=A0A176W8W9_MARPO|nr:hypothetical protein AXG93_4486s1120 [Marchantia polymorpha subsp. ruderalis]